MTLDPADALRGLQARDRDVQARVWREVHPRLKATCARIVGDPGWGEEIAQDVWIEFAYDYVDRVRAPRAMYSYLLMMATRRARHVVARRRRWTADAPPPEAVDAEAPDQLIEALAHGVLKGHLERCLPTLRPRSRQMLRLRFHREATLREIGEAFGVSKQAVGQTIRKALGHLRTCVEQHLGGTA